MIILKPSAVNMRFFSPVGSVPSTLLDDLISYWKLDESSAGLAPVTRVDSVVASGNDLTDTNNTPSATGIINNGANFTGALSQMLFRLSNASLQTGDIDFTVSLWVNFVLLPSINNIVLACKSNAVGSGGASEWSIDLNGSNRLRFRLSNGTIISSLLNTIDILSTLAWFNVIVWHDAINDTQNMQVNQNTVRSIAYSGGVLANTSQFRLGGDSIAGHYVTAIVDEVGFWKRVLTASERAQLYNSGLGLSYPF